MSGCLVSALCPYLTVLVDDFVAVRPVGADGVALTGGILAEVELILGDREVVLTIVDNLVDVGIVPNEYVPIDVDRLSGKRLLGRVCTRTSYLGDVEAVAVVTQHV